MVLKALKLKEEMQNHPNLKMGTEQEDGEKVCLFAHVPVSEKK